MGTFILLLIIFFILWPILRGWLTVRRLRRQADEAFREAARQAEAQRRANRPGGWDRRPSQPREKVIDPTEGEYVDYEEISVSSTTIESSADGGGDAIKVESQVVDVEWEEIRK